MQLREAFDDNDYQRMARELARLRQLGADPLQALTSAIHWSHDHLEFGWTHAYAATADWLTLYDRECRPMRRNNSCVYWRASRILPTTRCAMESYPLCPRSVVHTMKIASSTPLKRKMRRTAIACIRGAVEAKALIPGYRTRSDPCCAPALQRFRALDYLCHPRPVQLIGRLGCKRF